MSFTLEGRGEHYVKLSMRWCRGWVRTGRAAFIIKQVQKPLSSAVGIHFDFGFCRPIPSNVNLKKERPVCISFTFEGHGDHSLRKTCHVMAERLGENDTCNIIIKQVKKPQGFRGGSG
jgi:hypothetical protein